MKILMFGWEFPPVITGGLGTACYGLTKALNQLGVKITFILPKKLINHDEKYVKILNASENLTLCEINITINPYKKILSTTEFNKSEWIFENYYESALKYAILTKEISSKKDYDIIHAHDWMSVLAGINAKKISGKPLIFHIHSLESNRSGDLNNCGKVYELEKKGMNESDLVIANSNLIKNLIIKNYGINSNKIEVVYNGVDFKDFKIKKKIDKNEKVILYLGRLTIQKGVNFLLSSAKKVLEYDKNYLFIIVGRGEELEELIKQSINLGICNKVIFTGFVNENERERLYERADVFIMPSVSEPFGIVPLEAMRNGTPAIISKQSGVSEVLKNVLKVDFWDVNELASQIINLTKNFEASNEMITQAINEVKKLNWSTPARKVKKLYEKLS